MAYGSESRVRMHAIWEIVVAHGSGSLVRVDTGENDYTVDCMVDCVGQRMAEIEILPV